MLCNVRKLKICVFLYFNYLKCCIMCIKTRACLFNSVLVVGVQYRKKKADTVTFNLLRIIG